MILNYNVADHQAGEGNLHCLSISRKISNYSFSWSSPADGRIGIHGLKCNHPAVDAVDAIHEIAPYVLAVINWQPRLGENDLKQSLAAILHVFSHSSTFLRGQASIVEVLLKSGAFFQDFKLHFTGFSAQPDQHALSELNMARFVSDAIVHLVLSD